MVGIRKKIHRTVLLCVITFVSISGLTAEERESEVRQKKNDKARVAVFTPANLEDDSRYDGLCTTIEETVALNLKLIGKHEIVETERSAPNGEEEILAFMRDEEIDNTVYGSLYLEEDGTIVIKISVYDRNEEAVTTTEQVTASSYLDIFSATDELVTALLGNFSDRHIAYGALTIANNGVDGIYMVQLNGEELGASVEHVPKLLTRTYTLTIEQQRAAGEKWIYEKEIEVKKNETTTVSFSIPGLTRGERERFEELERSIMRWWGLSDKKAADALKEAVELTADGENISPVVVRLNKRYRTMRRSYKSMTDQSVGVDIASPSPKLYTELAGDEMLRPGDYMEDFLKHSFEPALYTTPIIAGVLPEGVRKEGRGGMRVEAQIAGGTLGVGGVNFAGNERRFQFSIMAGAGYSSSVLMAATSRVTFAPFGGTFTPTLSLTANYFTDFSTQAADIGPSLGLALRLGGGDFILYIENYFAVTVVPFMSDYMIYLPALGVKF